MNFHCGNERRILTQLLKTHRGQNPSLLPESHIIFYFQADKKVGFRTKINEIEFHQQYALLRVQNTGTKKFILLKKLSLCHFCEQKINKIQLHQQ